MVLRFLNEIGVEGGKSCNYVLDGDILQGCCGGANGRNDRVVGVQYNREVHACVRVCFVVVTLNRKSHLGMQLYV